MRLLKKKKRKLYLILLLFFLEMMCSGCGRAVSFEQLQAAKTGYRIGYVSEDYYRMTVAAYRRHESMPPITTIEEICFCVEKWFDSCLNHNFLLYSRLKRC